MEAMEVLRRPWDAKRKVNTLHEEVAKPKVGKMHTLELEEGTVSHQLNLQAEAEVADGMEVDWDLDAHLLEGEALDIFPGIQSAKQIQPFNFLIQVSRVVLDLDMDKLK